MRILVTGAAGFIGYHAALALLARGDSVVGLDNLNDYYDVTLKEARLARLTPDPRFTFTRLDLADRAGVERLFEEHRPERVVHLGAQAGVRYSLENPHAYVQSNIVGTMNILEGCRRHGISHLVLASTSSVYGANTRLPFSVEDNVDHPVSLYAATKKSTELMAHTYAHLYRLPVTGLRFFTVYGPWYRPDMALFKFTKAILAGEPIEIYNEGHHSRDFTYIDDVVAGILAVLDRPATPDPAWTGDRPDPATSNAPYRLYNIGNNQPVALMDLVAHLERALGRKAIKRFLPQQPGDVVSTWANIDRLSNGIGFKPSTPFDVGIEKFVTWYRDYYGVAA
jgi:UDP-glucuronate 4-epimerase